MFSFISNRLKPFGLSQCVSWALLLMLMGSAESVGLTQTSPAKLPAPTIAVPGVRPSSQGNTAKTKAAVKRKMPVTLAAKAHTPNRPLPKPQAIAALPKPVLSSPKPVSATLVVINLPARRLLAYHQGQVLAEFPVGLGRAKFPTPVGQYNVIRKVDTPTWENPYQQTGKALRITPGQDNPLGTRWIGFHQTPQGEFGIHGTDRPASVGQYSSHGCVRMHVKDAERLYAMVTLGTPVWVTPDPWVVRQVGEQIEVRYVGATQSVPVRGTKTPAQKRSPVKPITLTAQLPKIEQTIVHTLPAHLLAVLNPSQLKQWASQPKSSWTSVGQVIRPFPDTVYSGFQRTDGLAMMGVAIDESLARFPELVTSTPDE